MADLSGVRLELVNTTDKAQEMMRWLGERHENNAIGFDIETGQLPGNPTEDALSPYHGRIRLAQIGDENTGWAIPWEEWSGVFYEVMSKWEGQIITHNIAFEAKWMGVKSRFKMPWDRAHDTMIQAHIVDPLGPGALKVLTSRYVDRRAAGLQSILDETMAKNGWNWGNVPIELKEYWAYGALDTVLTVRLWNKLNEDCGPGRRYAAVYDLEMAVRRVVTEMEMNGARVDVDYCERKFKELHDYSQAVKEWGDDAYSQPGRRRSITSNHDLVKIFEELGAEWLEEERTPTGQRQMNKAVLKRFANEYGRKKSGYLAQQILHMRKASKLSDTYLSNLLSGHQSGLIHPNVRTLGARTGRMSVTGPALQTLPKSDKVIRTAFIARNPEAEIVMSCDLEQVEFRMTAALSRDPGLIELFHRCDREGGDAFTEIMREVYRDETLTKSDSKRGLIKSTVYGKLYGAGVSKMAQTSGVSEAQMRQVVEAFDKQYPGVKRFSQEIEDVGMRRFREEGQAYVLTKTGRRLPCDDGKAYTLTNYVIQGGAAEVFKADLLKCDAAGLTPYCIVPVHDEIVMSVPKSDQREVAATLKECMTTSDGWSVPLLAGDPTSGENWGSLND